MARRRRTMARPPRKRRPADWVYRPDVRDNAGNLYDALGSYTVTAKSLAAGAANAQVGVLYDSFNYMSQGIGATNVAAVTTTRAGRAEGRNPLIHRVEGTVFIIPSGWSAGTFFRMGFRFGRWTQTPDTGALFIDPEYSMYGGAVADAKDTVAQFANDREWQHERRTMEHFTNDRPLSFVQRFRFRVNRSLNPMQCYALYMESESGSVTCNVILYLRTLVSDEG